MVSIQNRYLWATWVITVVWLLVALLSYGQNYLFSQIKEEVFYPKESLSFALLWLAWIPFTYPAIWIYSHFPFSGGHVLRALSFYLLAATLIIIAHLGFTAWLMSAFWSNYIYPVNFQEMFLKLLTFSVFTDIIVYALIVAVVHGIAFYKGLQKEKLRRLSLEGDLSEVRLHALKAQLQPHFLFNTHHTIVSLLEEGKPEEAIRMILGLSDLLRYSLREHHVNVIPLQQEIELLNLYLNIQKIRFQDRLSVTLHYNQELGEFLVPAMVLQPLVENAIKHAVEPYSDNSQIKLILQKHGSCLLLRVQDNGPVQNQEAEFTYGIGLSNTKARLQQLYGDKYELTIKSNYPDRGVLALVKIPLQTQKKKSYDTVPGADCG